MRCGLCGDEMHPLRIFCDRCTDTTACWDSWAKEHYRKTAVMSVITVRFDGSGGPTISIDRSGGKGKSRFVDNPPKMLVSASAVKIVSPMRVVKDGTNEDISFWLRPKKTPGCTSKMNHQTDTQHLYIEPGSIAARLFVARFIKKLPVGTPLEQLPPEVRALLPAKGET